MVARFEIIKEIKKAISAQAVPGLFATKRAGVEAELPGARLQRHGDIMVAEHIKEMALGPQADKAQRAVNEQRLRALAFRRMGLKQAGPFSLMEDAGQGDFRSTGWDMTQAQVFGGLSLEVIKREMDWIRAHIQMGRGVPGENFSAQPIWAREEIRGKRADTPGGMEWWTQLIEKLDRVADKMEAGSRRPVEQKN